MSKIKAPIIKADGEIGIATGQGPKWTLKELREAIGAEHVDVLNLKDDMVMIVDHVGSIIGKPKNDNATKAYKIHAYRSGEIYGDAIITESSLIP
jgi:hypothetical protein